MKTEFRDKIRALRTGDHQAAAEIIREYEPAIRWVIRMRLTDSRLRRLFESMDICQSVMVALLEVARQRSLDVSTPKNLLNLLVRMAINNLIDKARHEQWHGGSLPVFCSWP